MTAHEWGRFAQGFLFGISLSIIVASVIHEVQCFLRRR